MSYREFYRRHLPHWQPEQAVLFVTFRLAGSLPSTVLEELQHERERAEKALAQSSDPVAHYRQNDLDDRCYFGRWDRALDADTQGPRWLARPEIAEVVAEALHYRDGKAYELLAYCIMPNHVHLVCRIGAPQDDDVGRIDNPSYQGRPVPLHRIMHSLKRHTARQANLKLSRQGAFWQQESYDRVVRDSEELQRIVDYVLYNPVKAGLVEDWEDWPWSYCRPDCGSGPG
jgi:putative transposase